MPLRYQLHIYSPKGTVCPLVQADAAQRSERKGKGGMRERCSPTGIFCVEDARLTLSHLNVLAISRIMTGPTGRKHGRVERAGRANANAMQSRRKKVMQRSFPAHRIPSQLIGPTCWAPCKHRLQTTLRRPLGSHLCLDSCSAHCIALHVHMHLQ